MMSATSSTRSRESRGVGSGAGNVFYVSGLGLTRDPHLMTGLDNMWVNVGRGQFHLPTGTPTVLSGTVGLVVPDLGALLPRLEGVQGSLRGTSSSTVAMAIASTRGARGATGFACTHRTRNVSGG